MKDRLRRLGEMRLSELNPVIGIILLAIIVLSGALASCGAEAPSAGEHGTFYVDEVMLPDNRTVFCVTDYSALLSCVV